MKTSVTRALFAAAALCAAAGPAFAQEWKAHRVPLFAAATNVSGYQGFVRVINRSDTAGEVLIDAVDDAGVPSAAVTLRIGAGETVHFNSDDLEDGNAGKGLSGGIGAGSGDWRLRLRSRLDLEVLAYNRTSDGLLAPLHDVVPRAVVRRPGTGEEAMGHRVAIFNPASNDKQVSRLRIINRGEETAAVTIEGIDDDGETPGTAVELEVPAGASRMVTSQALESGQDEELAGMLDDGVGKWQLLVTADQPVEVMSLLSSPTGHLTNLSTAPEAESGGVNDVPHFAAAANPDGYQGFVRVINRSDEGGEVAVEAFDDAGVPYGPVTLAIGAGETVHFNSRDLEEGNPDKGLSEGMGEGISGDWRLRLSSALDIEVLAYNRTDDGLLTTLHDVVPYSETAQEHHVAIFNPASNDKQVSRLRIVNPGAEPAAVTIEGVDDDGQSPGTPVALTVPARAARTLTSQELETGRFGGVLQASGRLGDGTGKWRLVVSADRAIEAMSLMSSPTGHLVNLSTGAPAGEVVPAPVVSPETVLELTGRTTASVGTAVSLRVANVGQGDVRIERFDWRFSDGQRLSGEEVGVSFAEAGVYEVTVSAMSGTDVVAQVTAAMAVFDAAAGANPGFEGIPTLFGDVNQDGRFGPEDHALAGRAVEGEQVLEEAAVEAGDLNLSGALDERDVELLGQALEEGAELPSALLEEFAYPGGVVAMVSPALLDPDADIEVFVDGVRSERVLRAILGYATFVVPASLTATDTEVEVVVQVDGMVAERLGLVLEPAAARPTDMTPEEDVLAFFEELARLLSTQEEAGTSFFEQNGGLSADDTAIVLGGTRVAAQELESAIAGLEALLNGPGGEELAATLQAALYANGLSEFRAVVPADSGDGASSQSSLAPSGRTRSLEARSVSDVCDRYVPVICALKDANAALSVGAEVATGVCAVVGLASFATANPVAVAGVAKLCAPVLAALGVAQTLGYFVGSISLDMRLTTDKVALQAVEETATISAWVTFSGLQELCGTVNSAEFSEDIVGWVAGGIVRLLLKKSVLLSKSHRILERSALEKFIRTTFGAILGEALTRVGLNSAFAEGARRLCHFVGFGQTDAEIRFSLQADAAMFNLQVSNGGLLTPKADGSGDYRLGCPEGFDGRLVVEGSKRLCDQDKHDSVGVSCPSVSCDGSVDDVDIPDPALRAAVARALRKAPGDPITPAEMATLDVLWANGLGIESLTGLQCATALTSLSLNRNRLTSVSLSGFLALTRLSIRENPMKSVSLSGLPALTYLGLIENRLASVSLSDLPALTHLYLDENMMTAASLSGLPALQYLQITDNPMTSVSLSGLPSLEELILYENQLTSVSLSDLPSLKVLGLNENQLTSLPSLSGLPALKSLSLTANPLTSVSLSGLPALSSLGLRNNRLTSVSLSGLPALSWLDLAGNRLTSVSSLSGLSALSVLLLDHNQVTDIGPLVSTGLGDGDRVWLYDNPLSKESCFTHIPALRQRGVDVRDNFYCLDTYY